MTERDDAIDMVHAMICAEIDRAVRDMPALPPSSLATAVDDIRRIAHHAGLFAVERLASALETELAGPGSRSARLAYFGAMREAAAGLAQDSIAAESYLASISVRYA